MRWVNWRFRNVLWKCQVTSSRHPHLCEVAPFSSTAQLLTIIQLLPQKGGGGNWQNSSLRIGILNLKINKLKWRVLQKKDLVKYSGLLLGAATNYEAGLHLAGLQASFQMFLVWIERFLCMLMIVLLLSYPKAKVTIISHIKWTIPWWCIGTCKKFNIWLLQIGRI